MPIKATEPMATYLEQLASAAPAPGGGSAAAMAGALGAALLSMVCNLTIGKEKFKAVEAGIQDLLRQSEAARRELTQLAEEDQTAYGKVNTAYGMPRATDQEKTARTAAIQEALKAAAQVPLRAAQVCSEVLALAAPLAEKGNPNVISDVGVGAALAEAALQCAALNVEVNLAFIKDQAYNEQARAKITPLMTAARQQRDQIWAQVLTVIPGG